MRYPWYPVLSRNSGFAILEDELERTDVSHFWDEIQ